MPTSATETVYVGGDVRITIQSGGSSFQLDPTPLPTFSLISDDGTQIITNDTNVQDVTSPPDPNAATKVLSYTLPGYVMPVQATGIFTFSSQGEIFTYSVDLDIISVPTTTILQGVNNFPPMAVAFSAPIDPACLLNPATFQVWKTPLLNYTGVNCVNGTWAIIEGDVMIPSEQPGGCGSVAVFTPTELMLPNTRYTIYVDTTCRSTPETGGFYLPEPHMSSFLSGLSPFYVNPYSVRMRLGEFSTYFDEEQLFYACWRASVMCNRETMWYLPVFRGGPTSDNVIRWNFHRTMAMDMFTELEAAYELLNTLMAKFLNEAGSEVTTPEYSTKVESDKIELLEKVLTKVHKDREQYYAEISFKRPKPRRARKSNNWDYGLSDRSWTQRPNFHNTPAWDNFHSYRARPGF